MTAIEYNERVREAARHQRLPGYTTGSGGRIRHKWKVTAQRYVPEDSPDFGINPLSGEPYFSAHVFGPREKPSPRLWRIDVGTGCVNHEPAAIEYRRENDPRGWTMPEGYVPFEVPAKILGRDYPFVDRPMWDDPRPFLLVTAPSLEDPKDLGGFVATRPAARPPALRTAEMWERDCYHASVWVSVAFWRADPVLDLVRNREAPRTLRRWRVFAGRFPTQAEGVRAGSAKELARLYLLRDPAHPEADEIFVRQRTFWNLHARTVEPTFALGAALELVEFATLAVLPLGAGGLALGTTLLAAETILADLLLDNLNEVLASASTVEFWN